MSIAARALSFVATPCSVGVTASLLTSLGVANAAIVTNTYSTTNFSLGPSNPDGAFYPYGTPAVVSIKFDDAVTYIGGPDVTLQTVVNIPAGLSVTIGSDVFTADTYFVDYYNAGPSRSSADVTFHTGFFPFSMLPVRHNGVLTGTGGGASFPVQMQFSFNSSVDDFTPMPIAPGLSFPLPPYSGEGFVRDSSDFVEREYYFGDWALIPAPGSAALLGLGGLIASRRRR